MVVTHVTCRERGVTFSVFWVGRRLDDVAIDFDCVCVCIIVRDSIVQVIAFSLSRCCCCLHLRPNTLTVFTRFEFVRGNCTGKCISIITNTTSPPQYSIFSLITRNCYSLASWIIEQFVAYFDSMKFLIWIFFWPFQDLSGLIHGCGIESHVYSPGNNSITYSQVFEIQMKLTFWIWKMSSIFHTWICRWLRGTIDANEWRDTFFDPARRRLPMVIRLYARY